MDVDFAFVVQRRHEVHVLGGRASAVGLNDLYPAISGVVRVLVTECLTSVSILRHPAQEISMGQLATRRRNGLKETIELYLETDCRQYRSLKWEVS